MLISAASFQLKRGDAQVSLKLFIATWMYCFFLVCVARFLFSFKSTEKTVMLMIMFNEHRSFGRNCTEMSLITVRPSVRPSTFHVCVCVSFLRRGYANLLWFAFARFLF